MDSKPPINPDPLAFVLLTVPDVSVTQVYDGEEMPLAEGQLALECVSLPIPPEIGHQTANPFAPTGEETHDLWLVVKVGDFEQTLVPGNHLSVRAPPGGDGGPRYTITHPDVPNASVVLTFEAPRSGNELADMENFEALLTQYGSLHPEASGLVGVIAPVLIHPPTEDSIAAVETNEANKMPGTYHPDKLAPPVLSGGADLRGKIVLVDDTTGAIIGELEESPVGSAADAAALAATDPSRPVVVDFGALVDSYVGHNVTVTTVPQDELDDWIFRSADILSRGILAFGSWGSATMMTGADKFKKHTVPCPEPIKVGAKTQAGLKTAQNYSYKGAYVSKKTVGTINNVIGRITGGKAAKIPPPPTPPPASPASPSGYGGSAAYGVPAASGTSGTPAGKKGYKAMLYEGAGKLKVAAGYSPRPNSPGASPTVTPTNTVPPALPPRKGSYGAGTGAAAGASDPPPYAYAQGQADTLYPEKVSPPAGESYPAPAIVAPTPSHAGYPAAAGYPTTATSPYAQPSGRRKKRGLVNRTVVAVDAVFSAAEVAANTLLAAGTAAASSAVAHRYGNEAGHATALAGSTVRNVVLVYVDARGVARRGLLKATAKGYVKAHLRSGETVRIQPQNGAGPGVVDHQLVVGVPQVPEKKR